MKHIFLLIKFWIQKIRSPRYLKKGSCKQCGQCCRQITFRIKDKLITSEQEFEQLKKWQPYYKNFIITGQDEGGTLLFTCKQLKENKCSKHMTRSLFCRHYPFGPETLDDCGYYFQSSQNFKTIFKR